MVNIRVLVVDDSVVVRRMVTDVIGSEPGLEVAGSAANGRIALSKIPIINPDIITLDVEMPEMDGLGTLAAIRKQYPRLPVIMFSTTTQRGAVNTIEALTLGANDYVTKPANVGSVAEAINCLREQLVPKIKFWCTKKSCLQKAAPSAMPSSIQSWVLKQTEKAKKVDAIAIGVSTGGPNALSQVVPEIPENLTVPVFIVQHMPPIFTKILAERLDSQSSLNVKEAVNGEHVTSGNIYIAPGDFHMTVKKEGVNARIRLNQEPPENSCRPAVDVLFRSVASAYGSGTLGVVLTGMGQDGLRGCEYIRDVGGQVIAQDEASSVVWGMPGFVAKAGLADRVLPLKDIATEIKTMTFAKASRSSLNAPVRI